MIPGPIHTKIPNIFQGFTDIVDSVRSHRFPLNCTEYCVVLCLVDTLLVLLLQTILVVNPLFTCVDHDV